MDAIRQHTLKVMLSFHDALDIFLESGERIWTNEELAELLKRRLVLRYAEATKSE